MEQAGGRRQAEAVGQGVTMLWERERELDILRSRLDAAKRGRGGVVLVAGEAGIGKTALLRAALDRARGVRVLQGACDPLVTPRPLGPLLDIVDRLGGVLTDLDLDGSRDAIFRGFLAEISTRSWPTVIAIEDAHWADEATLDLLRYLARRIRQAPALLLVTFRDSEVADDHPLARIAGELAAEGAVDSLRLQPLTPDAVAGLAATEVGDVDAGELHALTGGNPFFVTEVLAAGGGEIPPTVRDAVLARVGRMDADTRRIVEAASATPTRVELWLLAALTGASSEEIDRCVRAGVLRGDAPGTVAFRHELARLAIHEGLAPAARAALHARAAELLLARGGADPARIAHHAELAGDGPLAYAQAVQAARRAQALGAHREAADQYERALRHGRTHEPEDLVEVLEAYVPVGLAVDRGAEALVAAEEAVALRRRAGDPLRHGDALMLRSRALWNAGRMQEAYDLADAALDAISSAGPSKELAGAYALVAHDRMLIRDLPAAQRWGARAAVLAEEVDAPEQLARARLASGTARLLGGDPGGAEEIRRAIAWEAEHGNAQSVARGWVNLGSAAGEVRDYATAAPALEVGIAHARDHDIDAMVHYGIAWLSRVRFEQGDYAAAADLLATLPIDQPGVSIITTITGLAVRGFLGVRTGAATADADLARAWELADATGDLQRVWPVAAALAERAHLRREDIPPQVGSTYEMALHHELAWAGGELGLWLWRFGVLDALPDWAAHPYRLQVEGRWREAASAWTSVGCPYEAASALTAGDSTAAWREALATFDRLGARPVGDDLRRRLRAAGVRDVPRGPRPPTASHPAGLTPRQAEVLDLVARGLTDAQIAERLSISPKTCGHHVSAVLQRLGAASRTEAAHRARELGLIGAGQDRE